MLFLLYRKIAELLDQADREGILHIMFKIEEAGDMCKIAAVECLDELCENYRERITMLIERPDTGDCLDAASKIIPEDHVYRKLRWLRKHHPDIFMRLYREELGE